MAFEVLPQYSGVYELTVITRGFLLVLSSPPAHDHALVRELGVFWEGVGPAWMTSAPCRISGCSERRLHSGFGRTSSSMRTARGVPRAVDLDTDCADPPLRPARS